MALKLYSHPFASYCQKALIALYENDVPFAQRVIEDAGGFAELGAIWPLRKFPVLVDGERAYPEATTIIEYLAVRYPGAVSLIPFDADNAIEVRFMDRVFDNHVHAPMQKIVGDALRSDDARDPTGVAEARETLDTIYAWLDARIEDRRWAAGGDFSLADCAAGPALFYADWVHEIPPRHGRLRSYRTRLNERPSFARVIEEARPYRPLFPLGAPDRD